MKIAAGLACAGALALAPSALASQRYASASSGDKVGSCSAFAPCSLEHAINDASAGDEVVVTPGTYSVDAQLTAAVPVDVHGVPGQPRPRIIGGANVGGDLLSFENGGSLGYLYIEGNKSLFDAIDVDTTVVYSSELVSNTGTAVTIRGATLLRDSVVRGNGSTGLLQTKDSKVAPGTTKLLNTTVVASGGSDTAIKVKVQGTLIRNSIVRGATDIEVYSNSSASVDHSNFRPANSLAYTDAGGNQSDDPLFVDAAGGNLRLAARSPAIDAGVNDANLGGADADGNNRVAGAAPDLGAYETGSTPAPPDAITPGTGPTEQPPADAGDRPGNGPQHELPPTASPVAGSRVNVAPVTGAVRVRPPGSDSFVTLEEGASVPVNSIVDATNGVVSLTSAAGPDGNAQTGRFWGGRFRVVQNESESHYTTLVLAGPRIGTCRKAAARGKASSAGRRRVRRLWGQDNGGRFRTRGRRGHATVRGTLWLTEDRCDGTLFKVREGAIAVKAKGKRRPVLLQAGQRYLAR